MTAVAEADKEAEGETETNMETTAAGAGAGAGPATVGQPLVEAKMEKQETMPMTALPTRDMAQAATASQDRTTSMTTSAPAADSAITAVAATPVISVATNPTPVSDVTATETASTTTAMPSPANHSPPSRARSNTAVGTTALPFPAPERTFSTHLPGSGRGMRTTTTTEQPANPSRQAPSLADSNGNDTAKDRNNRKQGVFGILRMGMPISESAERNEAAKRTSEETQAAAKLASMTGYQPIRRSQLAWSPQEQTTRQDAQAPPNSAPHPLPHPGFSYGPPQPPPAGAARPGGLFPQGIKMEQARLLTLLRSLHPAAVVDQVCKALAYFGGIPGAPAPPNGFFPESARVNGPGSLFIGWMAEIFPHLDSTGNAIYTQQQFSMPPAAPPRTSMMPPPSPPPRGPPPPRERRPRSSLLRPLPGEEPAPKPPKRPRGRPKGSKSKTPRKDKGVKKGPKPPSTIIKPRIIGPGSKKMGRPKGSRNLPRDMILDPEQWPDLLKTATAANTLDPNRGSSVAGILDSDERAGHSDEESASSNPSTPGSSPGPAESAADESDKGASARFPHTSASKSTEDESAQNPIELYAHCSSTHGHSQRVEVGLETETPGKNGKSRKRTAVSAAGNKEANAPNVTPGGFQPSHGDETTAANESPHQTPMAKRQRMSQGVPMSKPGLGAGLPSSTASMQAPPINNTRNGAAPPISTPGSLVPQESVTAPASGVNEHRQEKPLQSQQQQRQQRQILHQERQQQHQLLNHQRPPQQSPVKKHHTMQQHKQAIVSVPSVSMDALNAQQINIPPHGYHRQQGQPPDTQGLTQASDADFPRTTLGKAKQFSQSKPLGHHYNSGAPVTSGQQSQLANKQTHAFVRRQPSAPTSNMVQVQHFGDQNYMNMEYALDQRDLQNADAPFNESAPLNESAQLEAALSEPELRERLYRATGRP